MNLKQRLLSNNDCYKAGRTIAPLGVMANSTGANNQRLKRYVGPNDTAYDVTMIVKYHLYNF